ncbi:MAG: hypothetical protein JXA42_13990 [Anaerolineales bacterium]|nr:hypothetical protein [Anaerolineales bacterium]
MVDLLERKWSGECEQPFGAASENDERIVGVAASGMDLEAGLLFRLRKDLNDAASYYQFQSAAGRYIALRPQNRLALELLQEWMEEPDDLGEAWWEAFDRELSHRLSFREVV